MSADTSSAVDAERLESVNDDDQDDAEVAERSEARSPIIKWRQVEPYKPHVVWHWSYLDGWVKCWPHHETLAELTARRNAVREQNSLRWFPRRRPARKRRRREA